MALYCKKCGSLIVERVFNSLVYHNIASCEFDSRGCLNIKEKSSPVLQRTNETVSHIWCLRCGEEKRAHEVIMPSEKSYSASKYTILPYSAEQKPIDPAKYSPPTYDDYV